MVSITVRFDHQQDDKPDYPVEVESVEDHLFPPREERERSINALALELSVQEAIEEAERIIESAPSFDHVSLDDLWTDDVTATVIVESLN